MVTKTPEAMAISEVNKTNSNGRWMNIKALFLALSRVNAFIIFGLIKQFKDREIGRDPFKLPELSSFQDQARVQQREFISRSGQGSTT